MSRVRGSKNNMIFTPETQGGTGRERREVAQRVRAQNPHNQNLVPGSHSGIEAKNRLCKTAL